MTKPAAPCPPLPSAPTGRQVLGLAWPMALKAISLHGTVVIDGLLVSTLGEKSVAAMGLAAAVGGILLGVIFAFAHALQIRAAQAHGTADAVFQKSALASGAAIGGLIGMASVAVIFLAGPPVLSAMAADAEVAANAQAYLTVFSLVILGECLGQTLSSYFNGTGRTRIPFYGYCLSVPINITMSVVLIHGLWGFPALGVAGAAWGSALGVAVQVSYFAVQWLRSDAGLARVAGWRQGTFAATLSRHLRFCLPIAATFISASFAGHTCMLLFAKMPLSSFAALTLILPWNMVAGQISMQWTQAGGILVAQLLGQRATEPVLDQFVTVLWRGAMVAAACVAAIFVAMTLCVDLIYPDLSAETRAILVSFLPILFVVQFLRATNAVCGNVLRASGDTVSVMHNFIWSQWAFRVPLTALFVLYFQLSAFWVLALVIGEEIVKFPLFHRRLWRGDWKRAEVSA